MSAFLRAFKSMNSTDLRGGQSAGASSSTHVISPQFAVPARIHSVIMLRVFRIGSFRFPAPVAIAVGHLPNMHRARS